VQRRLSETTVIDLVSDYLAGASTDSLTSRRGVNRTTIICHLDRCGVKRRKVVREMTNRSVAQAAKPYLSGESLKAVAARFEVDTRTLAREFGRAGSAFDHGEVGHLPVRLEWSISIAPSPRGAMSASLSTQRLR
jgi:hypothetical protein